MILELCPQGEFWEFSVCKILAELWKTQLKVNINEYRGQIDIYTIVFLGHIYTLWTIYWEYTIWNILF